MDEDTTVHGTFRADLLWTECFVADKYFRDMWTDLYSIRMSAPACTVS